MRNILLIGLILLFTDNIIAQDLENGLIGHWKLNNNAIDESINGNNGSVVNAESATNRFGHSNSALYFKDNGYLHFGNVLNLGLSDFSISGWFNLDENAFIKGEMSMISKVDMPSENKYAAAIFNSRFAIVLGNSILYCRDDQFVLKKEEWYHFTATFDRDNLLSIYLNGEMICQKDINQWENVELSDGGDLRIGEYSGHRRYFYGILDEFRMYDRVLSATEVALLYNEEENINCSLINERQGRIVLGGGEGSTNSMLSVSGTVLSDSIRVAKVTDWPDYVFSAGYNLMELGALASYIEEYGHLPGLPSAEEVMSNGISLKQIDKINLQKLEELSLYLFDHHDRLNALIANKTVITDSFFSNNSTVDHNLVFQGTNKYQGKVETTPSLKLDSISSGGIFCDGENVGIGTSDAAGYRLSINGGLVSEGVKVSEVSEWPDYVFSKEYPLLPLESFRAYIRRNQHLPGIPDAKTVGRNGYNLAVMDKLLMEKIEQLTLYLINQDSKLQNIAKELEIIVPKAGEFVLERAHNSSLDGDKERYSYLHASKKVINVKEGGISNKRLEPSSDFVCDVITCDGQGVGVGIAPVKGYHLSVSGGILSDDIQVVTVENWPDYVFEEEYRLFDLSSLAYFIEKERHLPGVPKAEVLEKKGYRLEKMDALLLEKIEEFTLYIIQQERQLAFLERQKGKL